jgi:hypothetical protein
LTAVRQRLELDGAFGVRGQPVAEAARSSALCARFCVR